MSVYFVKGKGKGWRYDFTLKGTRHTETWFKTRRAARQAEAEKRKELKNPPVKTLVGETQTDMVFLELANLRLDYLQTYRSKIYYEEHVFKARNWVKRWGTLRCSEISDDMIEKFVTERNKVSPQTANKEVRYRPARFWCFVLTTVQPW